jgi:A/G-specific adenine glycosylase
VRSHPDSAVPQPARRAILEWYAANGRSLAFRRTTDPYAILVSETMAQQTQAARAAERWERFMARFPTVRALAAATPADVLREWRGLGYDRRGLALWRAARTIVHRFDGRVPDDVATLETLPGVGPYTARAVAVFGHGKRVAPVDVNVRRVLERMAGETGLPTRELQERADAAVLGTSAAAWSHALMDVGATICRAREPRCDGCPVRRWCRYDAAAPAVTPSRRRVPTTPFPETNRWLRGRIKDRLRDAPGLAWVTFDEPIGTHSVDRVRSALAALAAEGVAEVRADTATGAVRARLALA